MPIKMKRRVNIVFFGDSLFNGEGGPVHLCWVNKVSERLYNYFAKFGVQVVCTNSSVSGDTTSTALLRIAYHTRKKGMDIFVSQFGMNDICRWETEGNVRRVNSRSFQAHLMELKDRAISYGAKKTLFITNPPSARSEEFCDDLRYINSIIRYQSCCDPRPIPMDTQMIREASCGYSGCDCENIAELTTKEYFEACKKTQKKFLLDDCIHLNTTGHELYVKIVYPILKDLVITILKERK